MTPDSRKGLDIAGLETVYDELAQAIDTAGERHASLFLVKLALLNAQALGDPKLFSSQLQTALQDLKDLTHRQDRKDRKEQGTR